MRTTNLCSFLQISKFDSLEEFHLLNRRCYVSFTISIFHHRYQKCYLYYTLHNVHLFGIVSSLSRTQAINLLLFAALSPPQQIPQVSKEAIRDREAFVRPPTLPRLPGYD